MLPRGEAAAQSNRGRRFKAAAGFGPAKGAGGRFIARADKDKPFAQGLKATDASGRAKALAESAEAERRAAVAQAEAEAERANNGLNRAIEAMHCASMQFVGYGADRQARGARPNTPIEDKAEDMFVSVCDKSREHVEFMLDEWKRAEERARAAKAALTTPSPCKGEG